MISNKQLTQKMDNKSTEDKKEGLIESQTKSQKKNKNRDKKRLQTLFRGPKVDHKLYRKSTEEESNRIKQLINQIMDKNSSLRLHQKKIKKTSEDKKVLKTTEKTNDFKITDELVLGLNSIIRSIEKKSIIGVILTNPLALPLEDNIIELCSDKQIPCLSVQSFDEMKICLNISSLSAIAFKPKVSSNDSVFNELYEVFKNILSIDCSVSESIESNDVKQELKVEVNEEKKCHKNKSSIKSDEREVINNKLLFDLLYTKKIYDNYHRLVEPLIKNSNQRDQRRDEFQTQESLIKLSTKTEIYFPETKNNSKNIPKIEVILEEPQNDEMDNSFAQSLIESNDKRVFKQLKGIKRKSSQPIERQPIERQTIDFKTPRIVRVEASAQKIKNRKQRKQMKKQNKKSVKKS